MNTLAPYETDAQPGQWDPPLPAAAGFTHEIVETPGLRTHVAAIGDGEPVVLLHGFPEHWWQWRDVAPAIARAGYRAICPDLRGTGWTRADDRSFDSTTHRGDILAVLDQLGIRRARYVAHDIGAVIALQLAYAHPERVHSLVQLSVPPMFIRFSPKLVAGFRHMPRFLLHRRGRALDEILAPPYCVHRMPSRTVAAHLAPMQRAEVDGAVSQLFRKTAVPVSMQLASGHFARRRLRPPTLVVFGREDHPWEEALLQRLCQDRSECADRMEFAFIAGAAHFVTDDQPEAVTQLILDWFERCGKEAASAA